MKKHLLILLALALALILGACNLDSDGGGLIAPPTKVDLAGATSLFLQPESGGKSITAPDGAVLMKLLGDASVGKAVFEDDLGEQVEVEITRTLQLSSEYLMIDFDYADGSMVCIVEIATGELIELDPAPSDWRWIRFYDDCAYYVAGGALRRLDLDTLSSTVMSGGDSINPASVLYVVPPGDVFCFYLINGMIDDRNQLAIYYADSSPKKDLSGSPSAYILYEAAGSGKAVEDRDTGAVYYVHTNAGDLLAQPVTFDETGIHEGAPQVLDAGWPDCHRVAAEAGIAYFDNSVWAYNQQVARITLDAGDIDTVETFAASTGNLGKAVYRGGDLYYADEAQVVDGVRRYQLGAGLTETQIITDEITDFEPVAGYVFYCGADDKTYRYELATGLTELYADEPIDIKAVME